MKILLVVFSLLLSVKAFTQTSTGLTSPSATGEDFNEISHTPANVYASDNNSAYELYNEGPFPESQDYYNFGFSIPDGSTIGGIVVSVEGNAETGTPAYIYVELSWDGGVTYTTTGNVQEFTTTSDQTKTYGGSTNTWGRTWSVANLSNANFRVKVTLDPVSTPPYTIGIDHLQVNVYYTEAAPEGSPATLVSYWRLNNNGTDDALGAHDLIGNNVAYSPAYFLEGTHSLYSDPSYGHLKTENKIDMSTGDFSINFGIRPGSTATFNAITGNRVGNTQGWVAGYNGTTKQIIVSMRDGSLTEGVASSATNALTMYQWNYVSIVIHDINTGDSVFIYVNGVLSGTDIVTISGAGVNDTVSIGAYRNSTYETWGWIDNLSLYSTALTEEQVLDLYVHRTENYYLESGATETYLPYEVKPHDIVYASGQKILCHDNRYASGVELILFDKYQIPPAVPVGNVGFYRELASTDYDGVCPSGGTTFTDADCAGNYFSRAPLRAILSSDDYASVKYIDFSDVGSAGTGTLDEPYNSQDDWTWTKKTAYLIKRGSTYTITSTQYMPDSVLIGAYGVGNKPVVLVNGDFWGIVFNGVAGDVDRLITIRDLYLTAPSQYTSGYQNAKSVIELWGYVSADIYNNEIRYAGFGIRSGTWTGPYLWNKHVRIIGNTIHNTNTEGIYGIGEYNEYAWNDIHDVNELSYTQPEIHIGGGSNNGSTGDVIEMPQFNQLYVHHNILDHGSTVNKACLMIHSNGIMNQERIIVEYNKFVAPRVGTSTVQVMTGIGGAVIRGNMFFNSLISSRTNCYDFGGDLAPTKADTIVNNVFVGFYWALNFSWNSYNLVENNTFYDNIAAIGSTSGTSFRSFRNNIVAAGTYVLYNIGVTTNTNNLTSSSGWFVDPSKDPYNNDFSLMPGSLPINYGVSIPYIDYDIIGTTIPQNTTPDAGAYEYITP